MPSKTANVGSSFTEFCNLRFRLLSSFLNAVKTLSVAPTVRVVGNSEAFLAVMLLSVDRDFGGFRFDYFKGAEPLQPQRLRFAAFRKAVLGAGEILARTPRQPYR